MPRVIHKTDEQAPLVTHLCTRPIKKETIQSWILSSRSSADSLCSNIHSEPEKNV